MQVVSIFPTLGPRFDAGSLHRATGSIRWPRRIGSIPWPKRPTDGSSHKMYLNTVILTGYLGGDAESRTARPNSSEASTFVTLSLATKRTWKDRETMTDATQALCFMAGANSIFTGEKLLTTGNQGGAADV